MSDEDPRGDREQKSPQRLNDPPIKKHKPPEPEDTHQGTNEKSPGGSH